MRCILFSSDVENVTVIQVPAAEGRQDIKDINDLDLHSQWLSRPGDREFGLVRCEDDFRIAVKKFPLKSQLQMKHTYTVCWEGTVSIIIEYH